MNSKLIRTTAMAIMSVIILTSTIVAIPTNVNATEKTVQKYFGISEKPDDMAPENFGYAIRDPKANLGGSATSSVIWTIREYQGADKASPKNPSSNKNIYCVKAGKGFANVVLGVDDQSKRKEYKIEADMKADANAISGSGTGYLDINSNTRSGKNRYDCLLALLDDLYIVDSQSSESEKIAWLKQHSATPDGYNDTPQANEFLLTEGDIIATQQAAIWYFTNHDQQDKYDLTSEEIWMNYTSDGINYEAVDEIEHEYVGVGDTKGNIRNDCIVKLYKNLISKAETNSTKYAKYRTGGVDTSAPAKINTDGENLAWKLSNDRSSYILGPISITKNENNPTDYTIDIKITDDDKGSEITQGIKYVDENGTDLQQTPKQLVEAGKTFYIAVPVQNNGKNFTTDIAINYNDTSINYYTNKDDADTQPLAYITRGKQTEQKQFKTKISEFDLKLVKRITEVNGTAVPERIQSVDISKLKSGEATSATYNLDKEPVVVKKGDIVTYTLRVYNEGDIAGYAEEITEKIPDGLKYLSSADSEYSSYTNEEKSAAEYNAENLWKIKTSSENKVTEVTTDKLSKSKDQDGNKINAFDRTRDYSNTDPKNPDYKEVSIKMEVISDENDTGNSIINKAAITEDKDENGQDVDDRDSDPKEWTEGEDDEDEDSVVLEYFDLALRKFIIAVSDDETIDNDEYLKDENGEYTRAPKVDTSKLNKLGADGQQVKTADYNHTKVPVRVSAGDIVVYKIRVYNEGTTDGYAAEIKDHLPPYLEFVEGEFNDKYGWEVSENGRVVTTDYLKDQLITKAKSSGNGYELAYKEVEIMCKVIDSAPTEENITNIADITVYKDADNKTLEKDRDSKPNDVIVPEDNELPSYKDEETGSYIPGQQDDDDFEKVIISNKEFDLALRKFIIAVSNDTNIEDSEYLVDGSGEYARAPEVDTSKLNKEDENGEKITSAEYNHTKDPLIVQKNDIVIYNIRVYNEGDMDGYAAEVTDHLPPYLEFVEGEFNDKYGWKVSEDGKTVTTDYLNDFLIKKAEPTENGYELDFQDVPIMCKVTGSAPKGENITNIADITKYEDDEHKPVEDRDSTPGNEENPEDDNDFENVVIKEFDLALKKWVTQTIVTDSTGTKTTNTGHQPYDEPEDIVKVEVHRKKINDVTVKFKFAIRVINEGDIEGYAKEITDYVPEGLKFDAKDNPKWEDRGNNTIVTTQLADRLLKPGEYADIEVILTWINGSNNMGLKSNTAEITKDENEYGIPDRDSTPNNKNPNEDDFNDAPIMVSVSTGKEQNYITLGFVILVTIAGGIVVIKKYVL